MPEPTPDEAFPQPTALADDPATPRGPPTGPPSPPSRGPGRNAFLGVGMLALILAIIWGLNLALVGRPVATAIEGDARNAGFTMRAHYGFYVQPSTLVLDLTRVESVTPVDLLRGTFSAAEALSKSGRSFDRVVLARSGKPVFIMKGDAFRELGTSMRAGENPVYLVRTFPEHLYRPDGVAAFGTWTGGLLGVLSKQMADVSAATSEWVVGGRS